jgi:hypothetical protein
MTLETIPLPGLMAQIRRGTPGAREELARRADAAMAGHDRRMAAIDSRYREARLDIICRYGRTDLAAR